MSRKKPSKVVWIDGVKVHRNNTVNCGCNFEFFTLPNTKIKHGPLMEWDQFGNLSQEANYSNGMRQGLLFFSGREWTRRNVLYYEKFFNMNKDVEDGESVEACFEV